MREPLRIVKVAVVAGLLISGIPLHSFASDQVGLMRFSVIDTLVELPVFCLPSAHSALAGPQS
jgi:hypothetical protein